MHPGYCNECTHTKKTEYFVVCKHLLPTLVQENTSDVNLGLI